MRNLPGLINLMIAVLVLVILAAVILIAAAPPKGEPVILLPPPTTAPIWIDISGAVSQPGLYQLSPGSRVEAAVQAAGGLTEAADLAQINRARILQDGEKIYIPAKGEVLIQPAAEFSPTGDIQPVNLNTATLEELVTLPGIGEAKAERIIAYREAHSGFQTIEEIQEVEGIGPETFEHLKDLLKIH